MCMYNVLGQKQKQTFSIYFNLFPKKRTKENQNVCFVMIYKNNSVFLFLNISKSRPLGVLKSDFLWSGSGQGFDF